MTGRIRIGTRGSKLALIQANEARARLAAARAWDPAEVEARTEIVPLRTTGDTVTDRPLYEIGGKGLFVKELEEALLDGRIDIAVHSVKDMPGTMTAGLTLAAMLPREDPRDAFIATAFHALEELPQGARLGTTSPRRRAQALRVRPDLSIVPFRGNVDTRLRKLAEGQADATLLAVAGLKRLRAHVHAHAIDPDDMLPAIGQGAIGLQTRGADAAILAAVAPIDDQVTSLAVIAERAFLAELDGSCRTPIAGLALIVGDGALWLRGEVLSLDGRECVAIERLIEAPTRASASEAGCDAGREVRGRAGHLLLA